MTRSILAAAALVALSACAAPPATAPRAGGVAPDPVVRTWPAMDTVLLVSVWDADTVRALSAMESARAAVLRVHALMSVDERASELSAVNRRAGTDSATTLSPWTAEVLAAALALAAASGGAFDPTVAPLADARTGRDSVAPAGWQRVRFDRGARRVWLPERGMRLDFGGIAQGFALDRGVEALRAAGVRRAVIDIGGAFAVLGAAPVGPRWSVGLMNPFQPGEVYAALDVDRGAVATSGMPERSPAAEGGRRGGGPDPPPGEAGRGIASVSVLAPTGMLADALSRAFRAMDPEAGCRLAARYHVQAVWIRAPAGGGDEDRDADDGVDPELVVLTDGLTHRLELLSEEPATELPTRCSGLLRGQ